MLLSTMESNDSFDPAVALAVAQEAKASVAQSVSYPPGFTAQITAATGISSVVAGLVASDTPVVGAISLVLVGALLGLVVSASRRFDAHNRLRIHGLRGPARAAIGFLVAGVGLNIGVAYAADTTDAWWLGIAAAPLAMLLAVVYLRRWLVGYRSAA